MSSSRPCRYAVLEAFSAFAMILLYIWILRFPYPYSWIVILSLMLSSHAFRRETAAKLGFSRKNLQTGLVALTPLVLMLSLALLGLGLVCRTIRHVTPESGFSSLMLYCV